MELKRKANSGTRDNMANSTSGGNMAGSEEREPFNKEDTLTIEIDIVFSIPEILLIFLCIKIMRFEVKSI